tara:strand:- start:2444 stop:4129 length:1686 start_codon:yes stop_codon:yes gene_type:complete
VSVTSPKFPGGTSGQVGQLSDLEVDGTTVVVDETNNRLGIGTASPNTALTVEGAVTLKEQAAADSDTAAYGQLWVKTATPNELYFTTDAGDDVQITSGTGIAGSGGGDITGVTAGNGLSGGGSSGGVSLALDLNELSAAAVNVANDSIVIVDADDSNASKKESIADLATAMAGTGLSASSGQLTVDSITSVGAVNSGSITSGFGSINSGSSTITTTGNISGGDITASGGDISLGNGQNGTVSVEATAHDTAGKNLTITAGPTTAGTTNNIAGGSLTLQAGQGKGSGAGGDIVFQTANAGGSGSSLNSLATALTISDDKSATFTGHVVFAESTSVKCGSNAILSDSSGTMTLSNIDALDATTEATIESAIDTLSNLTSVGTIGTGTWQGTAIAQAYIANDAINGDKIADNAIDSEHYTDGSIDTDHIADDQVTLAKMAGLARGSIIVGNASGNPTALSVGSDNHVLTVDSNGDIGWEAASGGSVDLNGLSAAAVDVAADSLGIIDANDSNNSKKESIADLATAMAGTGITATNGVFSLTTGTSGIAPAASSAENIIAFQVFS